MDIVDLPKILEYIKGDAVGGVAVGLYYLVVYWSRIRDGLGLSKDRKNDLHEIEKNYQLLKLRIDIEQAKKESGLDDVLLQQLEDEMQTRLDKKQGKSFTGTQKFVAIPLLIMTVFIGLMEIINTETDSTIDSTDTLIGTVFVIAIIITGFWGLPLLQAQAKGWYRKPCFIAFWTLGYYLISYFVLFFLVTGLTEYELLPDLLLAILFLGSFLVSLIMGIRNKLPMMNNITHKAVE